MSEPPQPVTGLYLSTTPLRYANEDHATGFFYQFEGDTFLITSKHALDFQTANGERPKSVRITIRPDPEDVTQTESHDVRLLDDDGTPYWHSHPENDLVDIAALPLEPPVIASSVSVEPFNREKETFNSGNLAFQVDSSPKGLDSERSGRVIVSATNSVILGYPLRVFPSKFPIARDALIATPYGKKFNQKSMFATDARTHPGLSGSPVVYIEPPGSVSTTMTGAHATTVKGALSVMDLMYWELIGVHSEHADVTADIDLSGAWYASLIHDILEQA